MNILFVCTGNTCRSPMASALMFNEAQKRNLDIKCESAGIFATEGEGASTEAIVAMHDFGIDLTTHHAQIVNEELIEKADLILTMTPAHKMLFDGVAPDKTFTIGEMADLDYDIEDPFGGDVDDYIKTANQLKEALCKIADRIEKTI